MSSVLAKQLDVNVADARRRLSFARLDLEQYESRTLVNPGFIREQRRDGARSLTQLQAAIHATSEYLQKARLVIQLRHDLEMAVIEAKFDADTTGPG